MSGSLCHIDIETFSEVPLKKTGVYPYADSESTEILCACYAFDDGPVHLWVPSDDIPLDLQLQVEDAVGDPSLCHFTSEIPPELHDYVAEGGECAAHNAQFERTVLNGPAGKRIGFPETRPSQWKCTAAKAAAAGLPRALEYACKALGTYPKDTLGKMDMMALVKMKKNQKERLTPHNAADKYKNLYLYCMDDVVAERDLDLNVPDLIPREQNMWVLDQIINDRGVPIDITSVNHATALVAEYREVLAEACEDITGGIKPTQTAQLAEWIRAEGYDIPNLQAATMKLAVKDPDCPKHVKDVIYIRMYHTMKAVDKYKSMIAALCSDERIRGMLLFHGAGTGRWSSLIVQLQNIFRGILKDPDIAIAAYAERSLEWIKTLYDKPLMKVFASTVRGMIMAPEGRQLMALDYSSIEARITAWYAGAEEKLQAFRDGLDMYKVAATGIFNVPYEEVDATQRQAGKIAELALGYQGGYRAYLKMATGYGMDVTEEYAEQIKNDWRSAPMNQPIVSFWYNIEKAAVAAVANPGQIYRVAGCDKDVMFKVDGRWLFMRLPSGRRLAYLDPAINEEGQLTYMGIDTYTRRWKRCTTYGGKLTENIVQATARDIMANGMFNAAREGLEIIMTVHDEIVFEVDEQPEGSTLLEDTAKLMCDIPDWAEGMPIEADGFIAKRYRK